MSFQIGIWNFDGEPSGRDLLRQLVLQDPQYGFDEEAIVVNGPVGVLYRAFHTTAESRHEHQPYISSSGRHITWDGRLDNREELIGQLSRTLNEQDTDVAIVAAAFDRWGTEAFSKLTGDWAISIWDPGDKELILARDYMGIRRMFYYLTSRKIIWCSHLEPLALCGNQFTLSDEYIAGYLSLWPDADLTPYREIASVSPGHFVRIRNQKISIHSYWTFNPGVRILYRTDAEYEEQYRYLFRQAVRRRLRTCTPILADLSGGFDSSSIVSMADDIAAKEGVNTPRVDTFSYHDPNEPENDDHFYLEAFEKQRGRSGVHVDLKDSEIPIEFQSSIFSAVPGFKHRTDVHAELSEVLRRGEYRVMFSGFGGDEINGQALNPRVQLADLLVQFRLRRLARDLTTWSLLIRKRPWIHLFFQTLRELMPLAVQAGLSDQGKVESWLNSKFAREYRVAVRQMGLAKGPLFRRPSSRDWALTVASLARQTSCAGSPTVERRYPYLDQQFVEFLTSIPLDQLLRPGQRRSLMRRALARILPQEILARKNKGIMVRCFSVSLHKQWDTVEKAFSDPLSTSLGYVETDGVLEALTAMKNGKLSIHALGVLNALSLELWLRDVEARGVISIRSSAHIKKAGLVEATI